MLNSLERLRISGELRRAQNRNGARIDDNEALSQYHSSLEFNPESPCENALFRYYPSTTNKPLVVLFLGNSQTHTTPAATAGINELAERLRRSGHPVIVFRVGCASNELWHKLCISSDCSLHTEVVYKHTVNILDDLFHGRGRFENLPRPPAAIFAGYSFGAGTLQRYLLENRPPVPVLRTASIDPIQLGSYNLGLPDTERPRHQGVHFTAYQNNSAINGSYPDGHHPGDISIHFPNETHNTIDENREVLRRVYQFLTDADRRQQISTP